MRFVIHAEALNSDESTLTLFDRLVDRLAEEVHRADMSDADLLEESLWYQNARPTRRKVLMSAVSRPPRRVKAGRGPHVKSFEIKDSRAVRVAEKLAHTPLVILVEDREADGVLLELVVEELGWPTLRALWKRAQKVTPRAIEIDSAGGIGQIPQRIQRAAKDAESEGRPPRYFVLFDSDCRWPGDNDPMRTLRRATAVQEACAKHRMPYHRLRKRCAENYIPDEVFEAARDSPERLSHVNRFEAFLRRSRPQRDHFPVKDGVTDDERIRALDAGLYQAAEEEDLKMLKRPLFSSRPRPMIQVSESWRGSITSEGLRDRDGEGELDILLHAIAQEL